MTTSRATTPEEPPVDESRPTPLTPPTRAESRAYLEGEAQKNQDYNDEIHAMQVEQAAKTRILIEQNQPEYDADQTREEGMEAAKAELAPKEPAPEGRASADPRYAASPTTADFKAGQASG